MKSWRAFTWVILGIQVPFAIWMVGAIVSASDSDCPDEFADACKAGTAIGLGIGLAFVLLAWALTDVILGVVWIVTNTWTVTDEKSDVPVSRKVCPDCAETVYPLAKVCRYCGHHFPTTNTRCIYCSHVQEVPKSQTKFNCAECGKSLTRKAVD